MAHTGQGLKKSRRLLNARAYTNALKNGRRLKDGLFVVCAAPNGRQQARLGLVVSLKVSHKAVVRNRTKRRIRESFRQHQKELGGLDVVVIAQRNAGTAEGNECQRSLEKHWVEIARLCGTP